jgi:hypothetical protein
VVHLRCLNGRRGCERDPSPEIGTRKRPQRGIDGVNPAPGLSPAGIEVKLRDNAATRTEWMETASDFLGALAEAAGERGERL